MLLERFHAALCGLLAVLTCQFTALRADAAEPAKPRPDEARGTDGRRPVRPLDVGLFLPRLILLPPKLALQLVFYPLRHGLRFVERHALIERAERLFYNDAKTAALLPSFQFLSSQGATLGVRAFHNDLTGHDERLQGSVEFGGVFSQAYELELDADRVNGSRMYLSSFSRFEVQPRLLFQGIGDDLSESAQAAGGLASPTDRAVETRYRVRRLIVSQRAGYTIGYPGELVKIGGVGILNARSFGAPEDASLTLLSSGSGAPIQEVYDTAQLTGFRSGAQTLELDATLTIDTRDAEGQPSSGAFVDAFVGGVPRLNDYGYFHWGIDAVKFIALYRKNRVLLLRAGIEAVEGANERVPFSDLPRLGGPLRLRGYALDRFRDEKSAVVTVEYRYPVHQLVSGALFFDAGRVARSYPSLFQLDAWRPGFGAGLRVGSKDTPLFSLDVSYGDGVHLFFTSNPLRGFEERERQL